MQCPAGRGCLHTHPISLHPQQAPGSSKAGFRFLGWLQRVEVSAESALKWIDLVRAGFLEEVIQLKAKDLYDLKRNQSIGDTT